MPSANAINGVRTRAHQASSLQKITHAALPTRSWRATKEQILAFRPLRRES